MAPAIVFPPAGFPPGDAGGAEAGAADGEARDVSGGDGVQEVAGEGGVAGQQGGEGFTGRAVQGGMLQGICYGVETDIFGVPARDVVQDELLFGCQQAEVPVRQDDDGAAFQGRDGTASRLRWDGLEAGNVDCFERWVTCTV